MSQDKEHNRDILAHYYNLAKQDHERMLEFLRRKHPRIASHVLSWVEMTPEDRAWATADFLAQRVQQLEEEGAA